MKYSYLVLVTLFLLSLQASAYKQQSINITVNGKSRNMICFTPNELPDNSPLMIVTHGMNQDPEYQMGSDKIYEMIDTAKFVVTYLRSDGSTWDTGGSNDQNFVSKTIDEMATRYKIDKDRVYWSGFSMGSMLIHHCIANMQNKIAAFAPTSGIQFSEQPWNNCRKPVNMLECIAYDDDVFGYEQYGIHAYIENYAKHDQHKQYSKTVGYRPVNGCWYDGDLEKWTGGPNGGEVWLYSYNSGGHWPMTENRFLIWNFCKRFSLNQPSVRITQPAGETTYLYMAPSGEAVYPDITIEATANATNGSVVKAEIYDGGDLISTLTEAPYTTTLSAPSAGKHNLRVVVTDSNGKTAETACVVNCEAVDDTYNLDQHFTTEGVVPQDWYVSNGSASTRRVGGGLPFTSGPRLLHFTNESRGFDYGLLIQNNTGVEKAAWARFGDPKARCAMTLHSGHYVISYRLYNWNQPEFTPVTIAVETADGQEVASTVYKPIRNIGGDTANPFTGVRQQRFEFNIAETGDYVFAFYADAVKTADFVLGRVSVQVKDFYTSGIKDVNRETINNNRETTNNSPCYDLNGRRLREGQLQRGIYIKDGRKVVVK
jgi:poly(3-hydroxybutyrate) depolymerase